MLRAIAVCEGKLAMRLSIVALSFIVSLPLVGCGEQRPATVAPSQSAVGATSPPTPAQDARPSIYLPPQPERSPIPAELPTQVGAVEKAAARAGAQLPRIDLAKAAKGEKVFKVQGAEATVNVNHIKNVRFRDDTLVIAYENNLKGPLSPDCSLSIYNAYGMQIGFATDHWSMDTVAPGEVRTSEITASHSSLFDSSLFGDYHRAAWDTMLKYTAVNLPSDWNTPAFVILTGDSSGRAPVPTTQTSGPNRVVLPKVDLVRFRPDCTFPVNGGTANVSGAHVKAVKFGSEDSQPVVNVVLENTTSEPYRPDCRFVIYNSYGMEIYGFVDQWIVEDIKPQERRQEKFGFRTFSIEEGLGYSAIRLPDDWEIPAFVAVEGDSP